MIFLGKLENLPMPPSVNQCYAQVGRRRVSSTALKKFRHQCVLWLALHNDIIRELRQEVKHNLDKKICLKFTFTFPQAKLRRKDGMSKKLDVSNRIKALEDEVCQILGFDDRLVWSLEATKVEGKEESCAVRIFVFD